ncbi:MAG: hypothetical protein ACK5NU_07890 [Fusobacterium ulcerans]|uniref:hypothetical protein n=1 Tax=Fusobacterium ulcerans TaxID=861 RepID=UPI003A8736F5
MSKIENKIKIGKDSEIFDSNLGIDIEGNEDIIAENNIEISDDGKIKDSNLGIKKDKKEVSEREHWIKKNGKVIINGIITTIISGLILYHILGIK